MQHWQSGQCYPERYRMEDKPPPRNDFNDALCNRLIQQTKRGEKKSEKGAMSVEIERI